MITFPSNTKDIIDQIREAIGRNITLYVPTKTDCPSCTLDPVTNTSTNYFCPTCSGYGYLITYSGYTISGHILWGPSDFQNWITGGILYEGDVKIQIEYLPNTLTILDNTEFISVDNKRVEVKERSLRGVPQINRILLYCKEIKEEG